MSTAPKLTKKQKKAIAFRERKSGKGVHKDASGRLENDEIPELEIQDLIDAEDGQMEDGNVDKKKADSDKKTKSHVSSKGKEKAEGKGDASASAKKKRKREMDADAEEEVDKKAESPTKKKQKNSKGEGEDEGSPGVQEKHKRFILFIGNLKYTTSVESIQTHFSACDPPPTVRLLTPKSSATTIKSKGCAFLEFTHRNALQQALKLHHSQLDGRSINVELTAGGGGKSETRLSKLKERNKNLFSQRKERSEKKGDEEAAGPKSLRYSATSGIEEVLATKKTWTVDDTEDSNTHRGGTKHSKSKVFKRRAKDWGSGANAIPVG